MVYTNHPARVTDAEKCSVLCETAGPGMERSSWWGGNAVFQRRFHQGVRKDALAGSAWARSLRRRTRGREYLRGWDGVKEGRRSRWNQVKVVTGKTTKEDVKPLERILAEGAFCKGHLAAVVRRGFRGPGERRRDWYRDFGCNTLRDSRDLDKGGSGYAEK